MRTQIGMLILSGLALMTRKTESGSGAGRSAAGSGYRAISAAPGGYELRMDYLMHSGGGGVVYAAPGQGD